ESARVRVRRDKDRGGVKGERVTDEKRRRAEARTRCLARRAGLMRAGVAMREEEEEEEEADRQPSQPPMETPTTPAPACLQGDDRRSTTLHRQSTARDRAVRACCLCAVGRRQTRERESGCTLVGRLHTLRTNTGE